MASNVAAAAAVKARDPMAREKQIASQFIKEYYTLLNKAPNYIHHFYNHDSAFIHGTIEMGSDRQTEPAIGRSEIENKMRELKLNDCRAKIEQIDCLETLAGGLVIQVIGELSNNRKPMRRFLQTFVLAPWQTEKTARQDGDQLSSESDTGTGSRQNSSQVNQKPKFYVLNNIFRYQDDGPDSEFEDDNINVHANMSTDNASAATNDQNSGNDIEHESVDNTKQSMVADMAFRQQQHQNQPQQQQQPPPPPPPPQAPHAPHQQKQQHQTQHQQVVTATAAGAAASVETPPKTQQQPQPNVIDKQLLARPVTSQANVEPSVSDVKRTENNAVSAKSISSQGITNSTSNSTVKKTDVPEKPTENNRPAGGEQVKGPSTTSESAAVSGQSAPNNKGTLPNQAQAPATRTNEPTWANIIGRNAHPNPPQPVAPAAPSSNMAKPVPSEQPHQQHSQATPAQAAQQIPQNLHHHHLQDQSSHHHHQQQQQQHHHQMLQNQQMDQGQRGQSNNRRRNMIRKTSNKPPAGRTMKDRPRPPATGKPVA